VDMHSCEDQRFGGEGMGERDLSSAKRH
jgi:hypothetical protein